MQDMTVSHSKYSYPQNICLLHVLQPLHEAVFVAVSTKLRVLCSKGIKLIHVDKAIIWQNCLNPHTTDVITTRCH
jgi:hypothetical protein